MPSMSDFLENRLVDSVFRGGALNSAGAVGSTAVVKGVWAATTAYVQGDIVVPHANMTGAGGKFLQCTTAGTSGSTNTLAVPNPGSTLVDGTVTWTAVSGMPSPLKLWIALLVINKGLRTNGATYSVGDVISVTTTAGATGGDLKQHLYRCTVGGAAAGSQGSVFIGLPGETVVDGAATFVELGPVFDSNTGFPAGLTEVSGGSYVRVATAAGAVQALVDWSGTQSAASTTSSTGTGGTTSNNASVTFPAPTGNWANGSAMIGAVGIFDQSSGGNLLFWGVLTAPKTVNSGDSAPAFAISSLTLQVDN